MSEEEDTGRIELILGPMFSGKSTRLIEKIRKSAYKAKKTIMVSYYADKRYTDKSEVVTHDLMKYDSIECHNLTDKMDIIQKYDIIGIDEGQFFKDLVECSEKLADMGKLVIVAALNGDFLRESFPVIANLIPKADKIKLLQAYCFNCHKIAQYSLRIVASNEKILIGSAEAYKPACRKCYKYFSKAREMGSFDVIKEAEKNSKKENDNENSNQKTAEKTPIKDNENKNQQNLMKTPEEFIAEKE